MINIFSKKLHNLYLKSGLILFLLRLPFRIVKKILNYLSTIYWKTFLKKTGKNVLIEFGVHIENPKQIILGNNIFIGKGTSFTSETLTGSIIIHDNVHIARNCIIDHSGTIILHENTLLSAGVQIFSHSHGYNPKNTPISFDLVIGKNCWIGNNAMILEKSLMINEGNIIGAGTIVTKPCKETYSLYLGSPASFKKKIFHE